MNIVINPQDFKERRIFNSVLYFQFFVIKIELKIP